MAAKGGAPPAAAGAAEGASTGAPGAGGRGEPPRTYMPSKRLQQTQAQVDEVVDIMRVNVEKVLERDQKLSELDNRAEALQVGASRFEQSAGKLKNKFWWQNMKMTLILVGVVAVVIIAVVVYVMTGQKQEQPQYMQPMMMPQPMAPAEPGAGGNAVAGAPLEAGAEDEGGAEEQGGGGR